MPHFQIDYSANLEERLDIAGLCAVVRDAAVETGVFPVAGIRVRATACSHVVMADGNPDHAFLDLSVRLRGGRTAEAKQKATAHIFAALESFCAKVMATSIPTCRPRPVPSATICQRICNDRSCNPYRPA